MQEKRLAKAKQFAFTLFGVVAEQYCEKIFIFLHIVIINLSSEQFTFMMTILVGIIIGIYNVKRTKLDE